MVFEEAFSHIVMEVLIRSADDTVTSPPRMSHLDDKIWNHIYLNLNNSECKRAHHFSIKEGY